MAQIKRKHLGIAAAVTAVVIAAVVGVSVLTGPSGNVFAVPDSIKSDCSVDTVGALNDFIKSVPNGTETTSSVVKFRPGCYRIEQPLLVDHRAYMRFECGAPFACRTSIKTVDVDNSGKQPAWQVNFSHHVYFSAFNIQGDYTQPSYYSHPPFEWSGGWRFFGSHDMGVSDTEIHNVRGDGVEFDPAWDGRVAVNTYNGYVRNTVVDGSGRVCLSITGGHDFTWEGNTLKNCPWVMDLEDEWASLGFALDNVAIRGTHTGLFRLVWLANGGQCAPERNITVENNVMDVVGNTSWPAISVEPPVGCPDRGPFIVRHNIFRLGGNPNYGPRGLYFRSVTGALLDGNTFIFQRVSTENRLVDLERAHQVTIINNQLQGATKLVRNLGGSDWTASGNHCGISACT